MGLDPPHDWWNADTAKAGGWNLRPAAIPSGVVITADWDRHESIERFQDCRSAPFFQGAFLAGLVRSQQESGMDDVISYSAQYNSQMRHRADFAVWEKSGGRCWYCGKQCKFPPADLMERMTIDHMTPWRSGGSHGIENLVPACFSCNSVKRNRDIEHHRWAIQRRKSGVPAFSDKQRAWLATFGVQFELCMGPCEPFWFEREGLS